MTILDSTFSASVAFLQSHVIGRIVRLGRGPATAPPRSLLNKLTDLGLDAQRIWWGPMVLNPIKIEFMIEDVSRRPPKAVLEIGGGSSTAVFAALAHRYGFSVTTLENHALSVRYIHGLLAGLPADGCVDIVHAGFRRRRYVSGRRYWWYDVDLQALGRKFDYVLVNGPMSSLVGRNGAFPELYPYLTNDCRFYFDDYVRPHERRAVEEWIREYPTLRFQVEAVTKNMAKIDFSAQA